MTHNLLVKNRQKTHPANTRELAKLTRSLLRGHLRRDSYDLTIYVVGAGEMTQLNERFLSHQGSTDVITFDYNEPSYSSHLHGEIFICMDEALIQARRFRTTWRTELIRYIVHGVLHLCGFDDHQAAARRKMKREENRLLRLLLGSASPHRG